MRRNSLSGVLEELSKGEMKDNRAGQTKKVKISGRVRDITMSSIAKYGHLCLNSKVDSKNNIAECSMYMRFFIKKSRNMHCM